MRSALILFFLLTGTLVLNAQKKKTEPTPVPPFDQEQYFKSLKFRNIGPFRGGRSVASSGVLGNNQIYYMGTTGGGVWKTVNAGQSWFNISDGFFTTGSIGAIAVADADPNVIYVGAGEHAPRGVMTSIHKDVIKTRKTVAQLRETSMMLKDKPGTEPLRIKADKIASGFQDWEDDIVQNKSKSNDDVINFVNKLTADYMFLEGELDSNTPYVPEGHKRQFDLLHNKWLALKARKEKLEKEVIELNADISKANIGRIIL